MVNSEEMEIKCKESSNDDYIEDEVLVYIDIEQISTSETEIKKAQSLNLVTSDQSCLLQINNRFFEGKFDFSIGTHVFFEKNEESVVDSLYSRCDLEYDFKAKTNKIVSMNRVMLKDINSEEESVQQNESETDELKITRTYEQALNLFLNQNRSPPRKINQDEEKVLLNILGQNLESEEMNEMTDAMEQSEITEES